MYKHDLMSDVEFQLEMQELARLRQLVSPTVVPVFDSHQAKLLLSNPSRLLDLATPDEQRAHLRTLFERVWLWDRTIYAVTPRVDMYQFISMLAT